jgi:hypothetical protein
LPDNTPDALAASAGIRVHPWRKRKSAQAAKI